MSTGETWTLGRRPALDGLRGVAVLLVVACHATVSETFAYSTAGSVGVTVFFTLSGFLITTLLLEERDRSGRISLVGFYQRRALRLLPALFVYVAVVAVVALVFGASVVTRQDVFAAVTYLGNWLPAAGEYMGALNHTWSLAVEEQFYVLWPLVLLAVLRRSSERAVLLVAVAGAVASIVARYALWDGGVGGDRVYFGSDTRADALLIGCAVAVLMRRGQAGRTYPSAATALLALTALLGFTAGADKYLVIPTLVAGITAVVIVCVARGEYAGWLESRWLTWVGRRSYGLYLWHVPFVLYLAPALGWRWLPATMLGLALSFAATCASWRWVESPFLRRRQPASTVITRGPHQSVLPPA